MFYVSLLAFGLCYYQVALRVDVKDYAKCHHNVLRLSTLPLQQITVPMMSVLSVLF